MSLGREDVISKKRTRKGGKATESAQKAFNKAKRTGSCLRDLAAPLRLEKKKGWNSDRWKQKWKPTFYSASLEGGFSGSGGASEI